MYGTVETDAASIGPHLQILLAGVADSAGRLLQLLGLLQRRPSWPGPELAERLGVAPRTVRRDAERLRQIGYAVDTTPGPHGGYRLGVGADMPPLLLDDDEAMAIAVILGISAGRAIPGIERAALATLARVDRLMPPRLRTQMAALRAKTVSAMSPRDAVPTEQLVILARACENNERVVFGYRSRQGEESERRAEPHWLVATDRRWYLVAHDLDRDDWRTFRVDRIADPRSTGHTFVARPLTDPAQFVTQSISVAPWLHQATARVHAPADQVARLVPAGTGLVRSCGPSECTLEIGAESYEWIVGFLIELGIDFEVERPAELRDYAARLGERLAAAHRDPGPGPAPAGPGR